MGAVRLQGEALAGSFRWERDVVRLEKVTAAGGGVAWIVEVPGTQSWSPVTGRLRVSRSANPRSIVRSSRAAMPSPLAS